MAPGQCGPDQAGTASHKVSPELGFPGGRQIPCSGIRIPCSGSNSALKFPARLRREFCKKTMQYQRLSHYTFRLIWFKFGKIPCKFPASREFTTRDWFAVDWLVSQDACRAFALNYSWGIVVEAVFDRGEARLKHWNRLAGHSPGRQ